MSVTPVKKLLPAKVKILKPGPEFGDNIDLTTLEATRTESVHYGKSRGKSRLGKAWQVTLSVHDITEHGCLAKWEIKKPTTGNDQCRFKVILDLPSHRTTVYEDEDTGIQTGEFELQDLQPGCCYHMRIRVIHCSQVGKLTRDCVLAQNMRLLNTEKASRNHGAKSHPNKQKMCPAETPDWVMEEQSDGDDKALVLSESMYHTQHDSKRNNDQRKSKQRRKWRGQTQQLEKKMNAE